VHILHERNGDSPDYSGSSSPYLVGIEHLLGAKDMTVAIIGSGKMGAGFARLLASKGFDIAIGNKNPKKAVVLAKEIGAKAKGCNVKDAVSKADVIFLAVQYKDAAEALKTAGDLTNKVVIDISNPITADFKGLTIGHSTSAAEEIQKLMPGAKVVKAFNTIFAELLPTESRKGRRVQVFIASDDETAKAKVSDLVKAVEFEPIDSGTLYNSRFLEPMGEMNILLGFFLGWGTSGAPEYRKS
jgi:predicted dinucleotide-binding enzyme